MAATTTTIDRLEGFIAAAFTPMRDDGSLDLDRVPPLVDHHVASDIAGLYVTGSTGEGVSLTVEERRAAVEAFVKAAAERLPVIVQVGHNSLREARGLAAHAAGAGASAISATPTNYFKPKSLDELVACVAEIATGAAELPFFYYHIPVLTGVAASMLDLLRTARERIPNFAGIKFTSSEMHELQACVEFEDGRYQIFSGRDEMLLAGLAHGVRAAVGSTYNFAAPIYQRLREAFERGDMTTARAEQSKSIRMVGVIRRHGLIPAQKAIMKLIGVDCGPTRLPHTPLAPERIQTLERELRELGFFEWIG